MEPVREGRRRQIEWWLVHVIALHSVGVGLALLLVTQWGAQLGGFEVVEPLFFARQAGVFHLVAACVYVIDYRRNRGIGLLVMTKCFAVAFLFGETLLDTVPWVVPVSGLGDGLMGLVVYLVHRRTPVSRSA